MRPTDYVQRAEVALSQGEIDTAQALAMMGIVVALTHIQGQLAMKS